MEHSFGMRPWRSWIARQTPTLKAAGSNPVGRTKMNDPTRFEQVDETCGLSRVILCLKSLDVTAFLRIDAPWKI